MDIISFDISGKLAHFRKFYSSSTALSFSIPPRTTIIGIIAAMLGREKSSYHEEFSSSKIRIGIGINSKLKKTFHRLNHLKITGDRDFRGGNLHIQTPFEVIMPENIYKGVVSYKIFISCNEGGEDLFEEIKNVLGDSKSVYSLSLGAAPFSAIIENYRFYDEDSVKTMEVENELINFSSAVNSYSVEKIEYNRLDAENFMIEEETLPADFKSNFDREVSKMNKIIFIDGGRKLKVYFTGKYYILQNGAKMVNIQFLE